MMQHLLDWDVSLFHFLNAPRGVGMDALMLGASWAGEYALVWWACGGVALARRRQRDGALVMSLVAAVILSVLLTNAWKFIWFRQRPYEYLEDVRQLGLMWGNSSFPSGHAVSSFAAATVLGHQKRRWWLWLYPLAALIALSRPYCGMHHPFDVTAGAMMGIGVGRLALWATAFLARRHSGMR
jgi:undecaprenyl-diphosphatase